MFPSIIHFQGLFIQASIDFGQVHIPMDQPTNSCSDKAKVLCLKFLEGSSTINAFSTHLMNFKGIEVVFVLFSSESTNAWKATSSGVGGGGCASSDIDIREGIEARASKNFCRNSNFHGREVQSYQGFKVYQLKNMTNGNLYSVFTQLQISYFYNPSDSLL